MADKLRTSQHLDNLIARHLGVGHADTRPEDWITNIHRDTYASILGHPPLLQYIATAMGEPREIVRIRMLEAMVVAGRRAKKEEDKKAEAEGEANGEAGQEQEKK